MASQRSASMSQWKEPDAVADKVLKRAEVSKVSRSGRGETDSRHIPPILPSFSRQTAGG